jgi:hypothetical protein
MFRNFSEEIPFEIENQDGEPGFIEEHELTNVLNHIEISEIFSGEQICATIIILFD